MRETFVDTFAWIAFLNTRDSSHKKVKEVFVGLRREKYQFTTTEFVLLEFANALRGADFREKAAIFIDGIKKSPDVEIISASSELFSAGLDLYRERLDKDWSLVDCTSFVVMKEREITEAFTGDRDFEQAGFIKLV